LQGQQDLAGIAVLVLSARQHLYVDAIAVMSLDGDGHVMLVHQQPVVGRRHVVGGNKLELGRGAGRREQGEERVQVWSGERRGNTHEVNCTRGSGFSSGSGGGWRSRTVSTRK